MIETAGFHSWIVEYSFQLATKIYLAANTNPKLRTKVQSTTKICNAVCDDAETMTFIHAAGIFFLLCRYEILIKVLADPFIRLFAATKLGVVTHSNKPDIIPHGFWHVV